MNPDKICRNCEFYDKEYEVCVNADSEKVADFVLSGDSCEAWETKQEAQNEQNNSR